MASTYSAPDRWVTNGQYGTRQSMDAVETNQDALGDSLCSFVDEKARRRLRRQRSAWGVSAAGQQQNGRIALKISQVKFARPVSAATWITLACRRSDPDRHASRLFASGDAFFDISFLHSHLVSGPREPRIPVEARRSERDRRAHHSLKPPSIPRHTSFLHAFPLSICSWDALLFRHQ